MPPAAVMNAADVSSRSSTYTRLLLPASDALFIVPFVRDDSFVGREDTIAKISERKVAASIYTRVALVGLGGVGATCTGSPDTSSNPTRFRQGYRDLADRLLLLGREDAKTDVLQLVHAWLSNKRNGLWLMILDNVDDDGVFFGDDQDSTGTGAVQAYHGRPLESSLPQATHGTIPITSRNNVAATNLVGGHGDVVQVEPMGEDEALALLHTRVPFGGSSRADAKALVHALERIPLPGSPDARRERTNHSLAADTHQAQARQRWLSHSLVITIT
ncbi:hypothetical protein BDV96DRAFT_600553 [Lophiotrema nucula]|uniref:Uncharacterized protein n=1 Tax=Lophiotrema nucula TaxID=690887 RepID=A0A6A5Z574_9PLEO|nr:hypothetical protein BDV96DRAFT_600553 [Lophiotrema nucula]